MPRKTKNKRFRLDKPSKVGEIVPYYNDFYEATIGRKVVMEIVTPNGHCHIYEDPTGQYIEAGYAIKEFMKGVKEKNG